MALGPVAEEYSYTTFMEGDEAGSDGEGESSEAMSQSDDDWYEFRPWLVRSTPGASCSSGPCWGEGQGIK